MNTIDIVLALIYVSLLAAQLALLAVSAKQPVPKDKELSSLLRPFYKAATLVYGGMLRFRSGRAHGSGLFFQGSQVSQDLITLDPSKNARKREDQYYIEKIANLLVISFCAVVLALVIWGQQQSSRSVKSTEDGRQYIARNAYQGNEKNVSVTAYAEPGERSAAQEDCGNYTVVVDAKLYEEADLQAQANKLWDQLPERILSLNADPDHIESDLTLPRKLEEYPFQISWSSSDFELVDADGLVHNEDLAEGEVREIELTASVRCQEFKDKHVYTLRIRRPDYSAKELFQNEITRAIQANNSVSQYSDTYFLPGEVDGKALKWKEKVEDMSLVLMLLVLGVGVATYFSSDLQLHRKIEERGRQMQMDYPQIISKFVLYVGAGMSVRNAFFKLGKEYKEKKQKGGDVRYAYEEIVLVCNELDGGISEQQAYLHFGMRCRLVQYTKFSTLLAQNLKKGNAALLGALQEEAEHSFEERKQSARQLGEEAGTKMLVPMIILLIIAMVMICIPVFMSI